MTEAKLVVPWKNVPCIQSSLSLLLFRFSAFSHCCGFLVGGDDSYGDLCDIFVLAGQEVVTFINSYPLKTGMRLGGIEDQAFCDAVYSMLRAGGEFQTENLITSNPEVLILFLGSSWFFLV